MSEVRLYVTTMDEFFADAMEMARKLDRGEFGETEVSIGFESAEQLLRALTPNRWTLLRSLKRSGPSSIRALAKALGRDYRGVHADVTALISSGLIERSENGLIHVPWSKITAEMDVEAAA